MQRLLLGVTASAMLMAIAVRYPDTAKTFALHFLQFLPVVPVIAFFTWASKRRRITAIVVTMAAIFGFTILQGTTKRWLAPPTFSQLFWFDVRTVAGLAIALAAFVGILELFAPPSKNYGPQCPSCGHKTKTKLSKQCLRCGEDWH